MQPRDPRLTGALIVLLSLSCAAGSTVEREGRWPLDHVRGRLAVAPDEAHRRIACRLGEELRRSAPLAGFSAVGAADPLFPDLAQLRLHAEGNVALAGYVRLAAEERRGDFYVSDPLDEFWSSEYRAGGRPVEFKTDFLLHLGADGAGGTLAEVIEYLPRVWLGKTFRFGHKGPGLYRDLRFVGPTDRDRFELLRRVEAAVKEGPCR